MHHSSASEDSVSDVSDPIPDYDDQGSQSSSTGNNNNTERRGRAKKTSREASSLSTDEGIYHEGDEDEEDDEDDLDEMHTNRLVPHEDEEDDEDELHDNEVSFSPHHQEDLVAIRNKRPPPDEDHHHGIGHASRRASSTVDATHEDNARADNHHHQENNNGTLKFEKQCSHHQEDGIPSRRKGSGGTLTKQGTIQKERKTLDQQPQVFQPPPPPPPLPIKKTTEESQKSGGAKPPSPPPLPKAAQARKEEETAASKAPPPPPPPDLPLKLTPKNSIDKSSPDDDMHSQKSDESSSVDGEGKRYVKNTASRKNSHQRTLPFIPPQFSFTPDTNENIRPSEYLRQTKSSAHSTLKSNSTLHRAVSMGELAVASKSEKISYGSRTESHETLLESDSRSHFHKELESKQHPPLTNSNSNGNTPSFSITVEQLQTVHLKKTDKPATPGMISMFINSYKYSISFWMCSNKIKFKIFTILWYHRI